MALCPEIPRNSFRDLICVTGATAGGRRGVPAPFLPPGVAVPEKYYVNVAAFTSPSMGDGSSTGPTVLWMENTKTVDVVLVDSFIHKIIHLGKLQK